MIILDATVLIGFLDANDPHHFAATDLVESRFAEGFGSSVLTVAEALVHPMRVEREDAAMAALVTIGVRILALDDADAIGLARVRNTYRLRMPGAVALHAALTTASELATFDDALGSAARQAGVLVTGR